MGTAAQLSFELEEAVKNLKQFDTQVAQSLDDFDEMTTCLIKLMQHFDTPRIFRKLKASSQEMADNADNVTRSLMTDLRTLATEYPVKVQKNIQTLDKAEGVLNANQGGRINTVVPNMQFRYY
ncbi:MAG TPA: hypothetical protein VFV43_10520 [Limnobacter sp.]|nr:hypothetical protein [Limnobacter sp.]